MSYKPIIKQAIEAGYRLFDTASIYGNEADLGQAIKDSGIARENFFISSKIWIHSDGYEATMKEFETSLNRLGTDYIVLYLIHQPMGDVLWILACPRGALYSREN